MKIRRIRPSQKIRQPLKPQGCKAPGIPELCSLSAMNPRKSLHPKSRLASFRYAFRGLRSLLRQEPNIKLHALFTVLALVLGWLRQLSRLEWIALVTAIALVWITEALNTCIEELCNLVAGEAFHPKVKLIKDIAAGAVLIASAAALVTGGILFLR